MVACEKWQPRHQQRIDQDHTTQVIRNYFRRQLGYVVIRTPTTCDQLKWDLSQIYSLRDQWRLIEHLTTS